MVLMGWYWEDSQVLNWRHYIVMKGELGLLSDGKKNLCWRTRRWCHEKGLLSLK